MENLQNEIQQAKSLERAQKNDAALDVFLRLSQQAGPHLQDPAFWLHLGELGRRTERPEIAADAYPKVMEHLEADGRLNSALAVARRYARVAPDAPEPHLRLGAIGASLGYAAEAREGFVRALQLAGDDEAIETAVDGLRTAWALLRRAGLQDDSEDVRTRILEARPDRDPALDAPELEAAVAEHLDRPAGAEDLADQAPAPGLEPTAAAEQAAEPDVARLDGLEPTSAGADWGSAAGAAPEPAERPGEPPVHSDLPLLGTQPPPAPAEEQAAPLEGLMPTSEEEPNAPAADEAASGDDLPLLSPRSEGDDRDVDAPADVPGQGLAHPEQQPDSEPVADPRPSELAEAAEHQPASRAEPRDAEPEPAAPVAAQPAAPEAEPPSPPEARDDYVDLGELILDDEEDGTRFQMEAKQPSGDEDRDFAEILGMFRQQVSEKIHPGDSSSHYDLGLAFKDMGLLDDAIGQLQVALRAGSNPVATLEVLGECFIEKGEHSLAARVLDRATRIEGASDSDLIGVLYWLGRTEEVLQRHLEARGYYERVVAVDISFRDAASRLNALREDPAAQRDK